MKTIKILITLLLATSLTAFAEKRPVTIEKSSVNWTGSKIGSIHHGEVKIKSAYFEVKNNTIVGGEVVMDMKTISDKDLTDPKYNKMLVDHLKSDDFFGVEKFPTATFVLTKVTSFKNNKATVWGNITIKGKTEKVKFVVTKKGDDYSTQLNVDRSKFDVRYGSDSFFDNLGDKVIDDIFILDISLHVK